MRSTLRSDFAAIVAALVVLPVLGCKDAVAPSQSAAISVSVKLAGEYPFDGFAIVVDHRPMTLLKTQGSLVVRGLSAGSHTVALGELASNCRNEGSNAVTIDTSSGALSTVEFRVSCLATTGAIAVAVSVAGYDKAQWFYARIDSGGVQPVRGNLTTVLYGAFSGGPHVVKLFDIPIFCEPAGELSTSVNVRTGAVTQDTAIATFRISCGSPPELGADTAASIAFERTGYVMVVRESGGPPVTLTDGERPSWSPDRKLIAFQKKMSCDEFQCEHDLWLVNPMGDNPRTVLRDGYYDDYDPALSPRATKIAFMRFMPGLDMTFLAVSDLDGGSLKFLSIWSPVSKPSWSPDGTKMLFVCWRNSEDLCLVDSNKTCYRFEDRCDLTEEHLTTDPASEFDPAWSHDGKRIAFTLSCGGVQKVCPPGVTPTEPNIAVMDLSTRQVTRLLPGRQPAWSPDGSQLVFAGNASSPGLRVYKFADGSVRQLTTDPHDSSPSWRE